MSDRRTYIYTPTDQVVQFSNPLPVTIGDGFSSDAFGRLRTSGTGQRLDVEFLFTKQEEYFDEVTNNGSVTFQANGRDLVLGLDDADNGSYALMSSYPVPYTPGNSQLMELTGVLDFAGLGGGTCEYFLRSSITGSVVETTYEESTWSNLSELGSMDWTKSHIFFMDFQSLKVGSIRFGFVKNRKPIFIGQIDNDNLRNTGYWQMANLPAYYKIYNTTVNEVVYTYMELGYGTTSNAIGYRYKIAANASATMKAICCTVKSEGGLNLRDLQGLPRSIDNGITPVTASTTLVPILSVRPKSTYQTYENLIIALPKSFNISVTNPIRLAILHDCTLTGASWADVDASLSMMEYDVSATAVSNGHLVYSEYVTTATNNRASTGQGLLGKTLLWHRLDSVSGIFTIAAIRTGSSNASCLAAIQWEEIL